MAGLLATFSGGGENEEDYDPHKHRKLAKPNTYAESMTHMLKGCLGAGLLAMPHAVERMGIILGAVSIIFIAIFVNYCIQILINSMYKVCKKHKRGYISYMKCMKLAVEAGPPCMRWSANIFAHGVDVKLVIWQLGSCAIYFVFVAKNLRQMVEFFDKEASVRQLICYIFPIAGALCLIKDLKVLVPLSIISNVCVLLGIILVFFYLIEDDAVIDDDKYSFRGMIEIPIFIGIVLFAMSSPGVMLSLEYNMENPKDFTGFFGLFSIGMTLITIIYVAMGVVGYLKYGAECKGSITLNLPREKKAMATKLLFALALYLSIPLNSFVPWEIVWRKIHKKFKPSQKKMADYLLRVIIALLPFACAVAAPSLGPFIGLVGALCLPTVAIMFPAIMDISIEYPKGYGIGYYKLFVNIIIILLGAFSLFSGVYSSVLEISETHVD